jgi:hypothetical protein
VLVIINSYGGSLSVAKNIASSLFAMKAKQYDSLHTGSQFIVLQRSIA